MVCLVIGDANADVSGSVEFFPREGDDAGMTALGFRSGGAGANVAAALARLGQRARLLARVGDDPAGDVALRAAGRAGVDLSFVQVDRATATGLCFAVISPGGERTFFSHRGANASLTRPALELVLAEVELVHVVGHALLEGLQRETTLAVIEEAHRRGIRVSLDLCLPLIRARAQEVARLAPQVAILFGNERELASLAPSLGTEGLDAAVSGLLQAGAPMVVAKLGPKGCRVEQRDSSFDVPAHAVEVVDTTGAGDGFVAGFLSSLLRGDSPAHAARTANVVGALVASRRGAAEASPSREEVESALAASY